MSTCLYWNKCRRQMYSVKLMIGESRIFIQLLVLLQWNKKKFWIYLFWLQSSLFSWCAKTHKVGRTCKSIFYSILITFTSLNLMAVVIFLFSLNFWLQTYWTILFTWDNFLHSRWMKVAQREYRRNYFLCCPQIQGLVTRSSYIICIWI